MGILWDEVFGWDFDRMRMLGGWLLFLFLFSGFISLTEGNSFWAPSLFIATFVYNHEIWFLVGALVASMSTYWWWRREAGW
jgi:hypothetical protein